MDGNNENCPQKKLQKWPRISEFAVVKYLFFCIFFLSAPSANNDTVDSLRDEVAQLRLALAREKVLPLSKN